MDNASAAPIVYEFIKDCLPKKDLDILNDAILNRASWNYGTSDFIVSRMDKHYRELAKKILRGIDDYTDVNGPLISSEKAVE